MPPLMWRLLTLILLLSFPGLAQQPTIDAIVNGASYASAPDLPGLAAGSIATIFGSNLASQALLVTDPLTPTSMPLPTQLAGTTVLLDGVPAPLFFVSPDRVDFQISWKLTGFPSPSVVVTTEAGSSQPYLLKVSQTEGPGIFTADRSGCGQGAILNVADDGTASPNCPANSVAPGETIIIFAAGIVSEAVLFSPPPDGVPPPPNTPALFHTDVNIGGKRPRGLFERLAPGLVGVGQLGMILAPDTPEGCAIPVQLKTFFAYSQIVTLSVHSRGGQCVDQPQQPYTAATLEWRRTVASGIDPAPPAETFTANFTNLALPDFYLPPTPYLNFPPNCTCHDDTVPLTRGKPCPQFRDVALDAGTLRLQTPDGKTIDLLPSSSTTQEYQSVLPANTIRGGTFTLTGAGGNDVAPFQSALALSPYPPIAIQTDLSPGTVFPSNKPFTVTWTGGRPGDTIHLQVFGNSNPSALQYGGYCECTAPATSGSVTLPTMLVFPIQIVFVLPIYGDNLEVRVAVESEGDQIQNLSIPGLTQGAQHSWVYEWRFGGVAFR